MATNEMGTNEMATNEMNLEHYENEGFLYMNKHATETFIKGEIRDIHMNLICPGVIVPIINPIKDASREEFDDKNVLSLEQCLPLITHYYPLQKGKKIRIYWDQLSETFMVSTEQKIYTQNIATFFLNTVNFDLLDKTLCYYAIVSRKEKKLILTNMVNKAQPDLQASYKIATDLAFTYHIDKEVITYEVNAETAKFIIDEQLATFENGALFLFADGQQMEYRNWHYNYYCMLEKPETVSVNLYYVRYLNKYAEGETFVEYFVNLHEFMREYLEYFPEHKEAFHLMSARLSNYIVLELEQEHMQIHMQAKTDQEKMTAINKLLELDPEELLLLLLNY